MLTAPDADNPSPLGIAPVHNAKWRMDEFPQKGLIELGYYPPHIGMADQGLDALEDFLHQPRPDIRHSLLSIPYLHHLEIAERGFGEAD